MAEQKAPGKPKDARTARGFTRAGPLIAPQMRTAAAKRGFAQARLAALWPEIVGAEIAALCRPLKLTAVRGPAGGLLTLAVAGAQATKLQMLLPVLRERMNAALGPGTVGRIQLTQVAAAGFAEPAALYRPPPAPPPAPPSADVGAVAGELSSIGDPALRAALETLARNVLSRKPT
jgi:hypothetical protein